MQLFRFNLVLFLCLQHVSRKLECAATLFIPIHCCPSSSSSNPSSHMQEKEPSVLLQTWAHPPFARAHSSMSKVRNDNIEVLLRPKMLWMCLMYLCNLHMCCHSACTLYYMNIWSLLQSLHIELELCNCEILLDTHWYLQEVIWTLMSSVKWSIYHNMFTVEFTTLKVNFITKELSKWVATAFETCVFCWGKSLNAQDEARLSVVTQLTNVTTPAVCPFVVIHCMLQRSPLLSVCPWYLGGSSFNSMITLVMLHAN